VSDGDAAARVRELAAKLADLSKRLGNPEVGDSEAADLAREAAELVGQAGNEIERALADQGADEG
jgi:hypothetical protein